MKYCTTVIAVRDMEKSLQFYKDLFHQDVLVDLGKKDFDLWIGIATGIGAHSRI